MLVVGEREFRQVGETLDHLTQNLEVGWILTRGIGDASARWAVLREANIIRGAGMTEWGLIQQATHVIVFGAPEIALAAESHGKPVRYVR